MNTICRKALAVCLLFSVPAFCAEETGVVRDNRVNVRGQATINSEVVTQLKKGETVTILEEVTHAKAKKGDPAKWLRIQLPANTPVWVNASFVDQVNKVVTTPKLNVRSGPGENFSVVARLEKGAAVKEIRTVGSWMEIEAPANTQAFVAAEYITRQPSAEPPTIIAAAPPPAPVPTVVETVKTEPAPVVAQPPQPVVEAPKPAPVVQAPIPEPPPATAPTVQEPKQVAMAKKADTSDAKAKAGETAKPEEKKSVWQRMFGKKDETDKSADANKKTAEKKAAKAPAPKPAKAKPAPPEYVEPREVTREGIVKQRWNIQAPTDYMLADAETGKTIYFLFSTSTNLPWKALKDRQVVITGTEAIDKRWPNTPVLKIETLKTIP